GLDAAALAREASLADVAALLWTGSADGSVFERSSSGRRAPGARRDLPFVARAQAALAFAAAEDPSAYDLRPHATAQAGWRILELLTSVAAPQPGAAGTLDEALARGWGVPGSVELLRAAMVLCADHELNVSAFTARCVASAGASPYAVVIAGLAALEGMKHGGTTARIEALWESLLGEADLPNALTQRLRRGEPIDGFGHPLYPAGDPRAAVLLDMLPASKTA